MRMVLLVVRAMNIAMGYPKIMTKTALKKAKRKVNMMDRMYKDWPMSA